MSRSVLFTLLLLLLNNTISRAQVCIGGLGDPIIKFTFGSGAKTFGGALPAGITNMGYVETQCPEGGPTGNYTITHSPGVNCFPGDWVNFTGDHTGDPNGYFMLINASTPPSDFYLQKVDGLCPSTSYQFGAFIMNMASHSGEIPPNITFNIEKTDGTIIVSYQTGDVPWTNPAQWNPYAFYFNTPPGVSSVVLRMRNNAPGGYGNDLALDDITFRTSGPSVNISITGHSGDTVTLCSDPSNNLQFISAVASCYLSTSYQWQQSNDNGSSWKDIPGAVNSTYPANPAAAGNYLYRLTAAQTGNIGISACQVASRPDSVVILPTTSPQVSIGPDRSYACVDSLSTFTATPANGGSLPAYQWMVNGAPAGTNGPAYSSSTLVDGDQVTCRMISNGICSNPVSAVSNTVNISLTPNFVSSVSVVTSANDICHDSVVTFTASPSTGINAPSYQWLVNGRQTGKDTSVYSSGSLNNGDVITAIMTSNLRCSPPVASNAIAMTVYDIPRIQLTPDTIVAPDSHILLNPVITGPFDSYQWTPAIGLDDPTLLKPTASPAVTTIYQLDISNSNGCTASAKERIEVFYDLLMPNAFTPNGDGRNDLFRIPPFITLTIKQFSIYNRWGTKVFTTTTSAGGWNGRMGGQAQPADTYLWIIEYDNPILKKLMMKKGTVVLIR
jgi:gliding motility-associated-like protein